MSDIKTAVVTITDRGFFSRAKRTILDVRTRGQWTGDLVLITVGFDAPANFVDFYGIITRRVEPLSTEHLLAQYQQYPLKTVEDNRHLVKLAQWNKLYVFEEWFAQWKRVVFLDAGLRVFDSIQYLLELPFEGKLLAPDDLPKYDSDLFFSL